MNKQDSSETTSKPVSDLTGQLGLKIKHCNEYNEDGVYCSGNLVVIDFTGIVDRENHTDLIKARIKAEEWASRQYPEFERLLCHPNLVIRLPNAEVTSAPDTN